MTPSSRSASRTFAGSSGSPEAPATTAAGSFGAWVLASRPKTLSAASVPVVVGTACAYAAGGVRWGPALAALIAALLLQVGANFANDLYDFQKGADTDERMGPTRVVLAGLLRAESLRRGTLLVFALALAVGAYLVAVGGPLVALVGVLSILSAVAYSGGPFPLGYHGLGDLFVFVFFGLVAVCGTTFVQRGAVPALAAWCALPVGALTTAILVVNNLRDRETDARAGKRTLAVRLGRRGTIGEYALLLAASFAAPIVLVALGRLSPWGFLPLAALPLGLSLLRGVSRESGRALNRRLAGTALLLLCYGVLLALGIVLGGRGAGAAAG